MHTLTHGQAIMANSHWSHRNVQCKKNTTQKNTPSRLSYKIGTIIPKTNFALSLVHLNTMSDIHKTQMQQPQAQTQQQKW